MVRDQELAAGGAWFPQRHETRERYSRSAGRLSEQPRHEWWQPMRERRVDADIDNVVERARARWDVRPERFSTEAECQERCDELNAAERSRPTRA